MNSNYSLETTLRDVLQVVNPTGDDWAKRCHVIGDFRAIVESLEVFKGATVEPFGSFVSNLFTRWGDLDISISSAGEKYDKNLLLAVKKALETIGGFDGINYIPEARVPIVKCDSTKDKISCDISLNNLSSQMKSKMLYWINEIDKRFRDIVLIVKEWAKAHSINDPKTGTLNSYSLSLLVIFHFQTCDPPLLPPLSEFYPWNMAADLTGVRAIAEINIEHICSRNINRFKANMSRIPNRSSLSDLFISFLAKFCDISVRGQHKRISPQNGKWEDIRHPPTCALFIEDPFEQPTNCARVEIPKKKLVIEQAFQSTYKQLTSGKLQHPLSVLVSPKVRSIISTSQAGSSSGILRMNHSIMNPQANTNPNGSKQHVLWRSLFHEHAQKLRKSIPVFSTVNEGFDLMPKFRSTVTFAGQMFKSTNTFQQLNMVEEDVSMIAYITITQNCKSDALRLIIEDKTSCKSILVEMGVKLNLGIPKYKLVQVDNLQGPLSPSFCSSVVFDGVSYQGDFCKTNKQSEQGDFCKTKKQFEQLAARAVILKILDSEQGLTVAEIVNCKLRQFE